MQNVNTTQVAKILIKDLIDFKNQGKNLNTEELIKNLQFNQELIDYYTELTGTPKP